MSASVDTREELVSAGSGSKQNFLVRYVTSHPIGFWFFFWGEFAERCSYYGMRAILAKYMADQLGLGQANASTYVSFFIAACYFLPLAGGYIADRFFGKYWTIVGFSIPYIMGHVILGVESVTFMVIALTLLAMGSGVIKPNISTLMGLTYDQYRPGQTKLRSDAFSIFYFAINIGAAISQFAMPPIRTNYGYAIAFLFPAALMVMAFLIFAAGKRFYAVETREAKPKSPGERSAQWVVLRRLLGLFLLVMFFWAIFDQASSTWVFFTEACMDRHIFGYEMDPDQLQSLNPVFILILLPPITLLVKWLDSRGLTIRPTGKMTVGFLLTAGCMGVMALAAWLAGAAELRPANVEGEKETDELTISISGVKPVELKGRGKVTVAGPNAIGILLKKPGPEKDGKPTWTDEKYTVVGSDLLKIVSDKEDGKSEITRVRIEGPVAKIEKSEKDDKKVIAEAPTGVTVQGPLQIEDRWFVAPSRQVTVWWLVFAYIIITVAEILISVTGLELAYTAAPKSMTGFVTACWLLTVGLANLLINAYVTRRYTDMQPMHYFAMLTTAMVVVTLAFVFIARRFNRAAPQSEVTGALADVSGAIGLAKSEEE
jgi:solute carrier family 15 (oligopeptide transporter), member 1